MPRLAILDRDGTVNVDRGYLHRAEDWQFTRGAVQAMKSLQRAGFRIVLATNQSGIARGFYTQQDVELLHDYVRYELARQGVVLDAIAVCPHGPDDDCDCRKPAAGLARQIEPAFHDPIDYAQSWTVGDKLSDIRFGQTLGTHTALIHSGYWVEDQITEAPDLIADSLHDAVQQILSWKLDRNSTVRGRWQ